MFTIVLVCDANRSDDMWNCPKDRWFTPYFLKDSKLKSINAANRSIIADLYAGRVETSRQKW